MRRLETERLGLAFLSGVECLQQLAQCTPALLEFVSASRWRGLLDVFLYKRRHQIFAAKFLVILKVVRSLTRGSGKAFVALCFSDPFWTGLFGFSLIV